MPVLCMSPDDADIYAETDHLAKNYKEYVFDYDPTDLRSIREIKGERLTLLGHGNRSQFGHARLTPQMLAADLIAGGLPTTIKTIDLAGCCIGEADDQKSYAGLFTEELLKHDEYNHIQVNAFTNLVSDEPIAEVLLLSGATVSELHLTGMTSEAKNNYDKALASELDAYPVRSLKELSDFHREQKVAVSEMIREHKLQSSNETSETLSIEELSQKRDEHQKLQETFLEKYREKRIKIIENLCRRFSYTFYCGNDIRRTLDNNPNFHLSAEIFATLAKLSPSRKIVLRLLNTRLAELKEELFQEKNSYRATRFIRHAVYFNLPESRENIEHQIAALTAIRDIVNDSHQDISNVHLAVAEALHDDKLNTAENRLLADKVIQALNVNRNNLEQHWLDTKKVLKL